MKYALHTALSHPTSGLIALIVAILGFGQWLPAQELSELRIGMEEQSVRLSASGPDFGVLRIEESGNLVEWQPFLVAHGQQTDFLDLRGTDDGRRFYRFLHSPKTDEDDWKHQVGSVDDPFLSPPSAEEGALRWIKFIIELDAPHRVVFQDSTKYPFHFDLARARLEPFREVDPLEFDRLTLHPSSQTAVLGAIVFPPDGTVNEIGIQFAGNAPFPVEKVLQWFALVRHSIVAPPETTFFYFPSFEQTAVTLENLEAFAGHGVLVSSAARWVETDQCYSEGWAFGRVVFVEASRIEAAYSEGTLKHTDILLTDAVPAEIPPVAGVISRSPATPNSHVAILSRSYRIPFVHLAREEDWERLSSWDGQEILLLAEITSGRCSVNTFNVEGQLTVFQKARLQAAKAVPPLELTPIESSGQWSLPVDGLNPDAIRFVGGKAANFGLLRRSIPEHSPDPAIAFTFDLWTAFLEQTMAGDQTLKAVISEKLNRYRFPVQDVAALKHDLEEIRTMIKTEARFSEAQRAGILGALESFDDGRKIRFRSSTNVEDSEHFVGAGLYDSFSGCVRDDTDQDDEGPSHCDPEKASERGVFRAIKKVFASFYNDNAFLERLRHQVDEETVGMAVLVHYSFPDEIERANGVATLRVMREQESETLWMAGELVSQAGAVSIANPENNALPEVVSFEEMQGQVPALQVLEHSSLVPLGAKVLQWAEEYHHLLDLLERATVAYLAAYPEKTEVLLDFEYKLVAPRKLVIKQIREIPTPSNESEPPPFVLNDIGQLEVFQHHGKDLFANHRLKSIWDFQALQIEGDSLGAAFDFVVDLQYHDGDAVQSFSGLMSQLPHADITIGEERVSYSWSFGVGEGKRDYTLDFSFANPVDEEEFVALSEAILIELSVDYATAQPRLTATSPPRLEQIRSEKTRMIPLEQVIERTLERTRTFKVKEVTVEASYTWGIFKFPAPGIGIFDGKSFPLVSWTEPTRIEGLTSQPIELSGEFSRTYDSNRHNFLEVFLLVPHLDPTVDPAMLAELRDRNIQGLLVSQWTADDRSEPSMFIWGFDDRLRDL